MVKIIKKTLYYIDGMSFYTKKEAQEFIDSGEYQKKLNEEQLIKINNELSYIFKNCKFNIDDSFIINLRELLNKKYELEDVSQNEGEE